MAENIDTPAPSRADPLAETDLRDPAIVSDPHPTYAWLQARAPVAWNEQLHAWLVTDYEHVRRGLGDPKLSVEKLEPFAAHATRAAAADVDVLSRALSDWMVFKDPPRHSRLRRALKDVFMPKAIRELRPKVDAVVAELLDALPADGVCDIVESFAYPLPAIVISDLFGMPRAEVAQLKAWSDDVGKFVLQATDVADVHGPAAQAVREMSARFHDLVAAHRRRPEDDFTSHMIEHAEGLSDDEIVHTLVFVLFAGHETTTNLIASAIFHLSQAPENYAALRSAPELIADAVEEFLRFEGPVQMLVRLAKVDLEMAGQRIRAGERLYLVLNAANRDPEVFAHPHELELERGNNRHLGFGRGIHMCLGAPLARLEGEAALAGLTARFSRIESDEVTWRQNLIIRGPRHLPVHLQKKA